MSVDWCCLFYRTACTSVDWCCLFYRTACTSASYVRAAAPPAPATGGMETSTLARPSSCRPTGDISSCHTQVVLVAQMSVVLRC